MGDAFIHACVTKEAKLMGEEAQFLLPDAFDDNRDVALSFSVLESGGDSTPSARRVLLDSSHAKSGNGPLHSRSYTFVRPTTRNDVKFAGDDAGSLPSSSCSFSCPSSFIGVIPTLVASVKSNVMTS